ncbi:putative transcriptional regulator [Bacillus sp. TS-2]|nr:putative transcriptional regulator [Bacillus sp. TS-2]
MDEYREVLLKIEAAVHHITKNLTPEIEQLSQLNLSRTQEAILLLFLRNPNITLKELADFLDISKSAVTQIVNKLEDKDLLMRTINLENRREVRLSLGQKGEIVKKELQQFEKKVVNEYIKKIPIEDLKHSLHTLEQFEEIIRETKNHS